jgi:hypothetical protein
MDTFLLCAMFARFSELLSVLRGLIPELIMSQKWARFAMVAEFGAVEVYWLILPTM